MDLRTKIIEVFAVLILIAESAWVLFSLQHKLNLPTVQSRAMHLLIQFALETEEQKQEILLQAEKERIYFWPGNGMPIVSELSLAERLDGVLSERYGEEYRSLPEEELRMMREDTLPWLEQSVLARDGYLEISEFSRKSHAMAFSVQRRKKFHCHQPGADDPIYLAWV